MILAIFSPRKKQEKQNKSSGWSFFKLFSVWLMNPKIFSLQRKMWPFANGWWTFLLTLFKNKNKKQMANHLMKIMLVKEQITSQKHKECSSGRLEGCRFATCLVNFMVWLKSRVVLITQLLRVTQTKKNRQKKTNKKNTVLCEVGQASRTSLCL